MDTFQIFGPNSAPATVSYDVTWRVSGPVQHFRPGSSDPTDPTNFSGEFRFGVASGSFSGASITAPGGDPFSFHGAGTSEGFFAEMGTERNGFFNSPGPP